MNCPYCAEEIRDEAVLCRYCQRDLSLVKPLLAKLSVLEAAMEDLPRFAQSQQASRLGGPFPAMLASALGVVMTSGFFLVTLAPQPQEAAILLAMVVPPAALGILLGVTWRGRYVKSYLLFGAAMGWLNLLVVRYLLTSLPTAGEFNWPWALLVFAVAQPLVFASGGLIGDAVEDRWYPTPELQLSPGRFELALERLAKGSKNLQIIYTLAAQLLAALLLIASHLGLYDR